MGKFLSRFVLGTAVGLALFWLWGRLNQQEEGDFEDGEVIEIQIGGDNTVASSTSAKTEQKTEAAKARRNGANDDGSAAVTARDASDRAEAMASLQGGMSAMQGMQGGNIEWANADSGAAPFEQAKVNADTSSGDGAANLEWVNGIGPMFNEVLAEHGIRTNKDLAKATVAQLRATNINRSDEEFASWIQQAKDKLAGK